MKAVLCDLLKNGKEQEINKVLYSLTTVRIVKSLPFEKRLLFLRELLYLSH